jgi:broad specificity phosphatase PhoE
MSTRTTVHLLRHGEVHNPEKVLYGRLPGYVLSELGHVMAQRAADALKGRDIAFLVSSPLERAVQTAGPLSAAFSLPIATDERIIEAANIFEGKKVAVGDGVLRHPRYWHHLRNPFSPSWGEHYVDLATRMMAAIHEARITAAGREAVLVSHQLPVWVARLAFEQRRFWHDPRRRECSLASITSLHFRDDQFIGLDYAEPSADLLPGASKVAGA